MAEIRLSDYLAYVFSEISRARDMADRYSKEIALAYAKDDVLRHFSVPRFKLSKMDLTMPVLVSGVEVSSLMQFQMNRNDFGKFILKKVLDVLALVLAVKSGTKRTNSSTDGVDPLIDVFYQQVTTLPDPSRPENVISEHWSGVVMRVLTNNGVPNELIKLKVVAELLNQALLEVIEALKAKWGVPKATIERLMVDAETNVVKGGSSDTSVFTLKAELIEEGLIIKSVKDEETGAETTVVEFE